MEMGVKCAFFPPDPKTREYFDGRLNGSALRTGAADADAVYERTDRVDLSKIEPMVACPHEVENTEADRREWPEPHIDQVFLGSCANAKYEDLVVASPAY